MIKNSINVNGTYHFFVNAVTKVLLFLKMETQNHRFVRNLKENLSITHVSKSIVKQRLPYTSFEVHGSRYGIVSPSLDKYTRAFDVIDVLYQSLRTSLNAYNTYETVSDRISDYKGMLKDFNEKCLSRGNIVSTDTLIISINVRALAKIADEGDNLYRSVSDLVLYATGAAACSTSNLLTVLNAINQSLDKNIAFFMIVKILICHYPKIRN